MGAVLAIACTPALVLGAIDMRAASNRYMATVVAANLGDAVGWGSNLLVACPQDGMSWTAQMSPDVDAADRITVYFERQIKERMLPAEWVVECGSKTLRGAIALSRPWFVRPSSLE